MYSPPTFRGMTAYLISLTHQVLVYIAYVEKIPQHRICISTIQPTVNMHKAATIVSRPGRIQTKYCTCILSYAQYQ